MNLVNFKNTDQQEIRRQFEANQSLAKMVADSMGQERFIEAALQLLKQPSLAACTQESVLGGLLKAAMFNFRLSPELGQCWLIPRKVKTGHKDEKSGKDIYADVATFQIGYKGWMELSFRSGEVESFSAETVWEGDTFDFEQGTTPFLKYKPSKTPANRGKRTHVWAGAVMRSGRIVFNVVDIDEVERHRKMSDNQKEWNNGQPKIADNPVGIWGQHYDQMAKRIPMRHLCTLQLPKSEILLQAATVDGGATALSENQVIDIPIAEIEEKAQVELHQDYIDEIEMCRTKEAVTETWERRKGEFSNDELKRSYYAIINEKFKSLQQNG